MFLLYEKQQYSKETKLDQVNGVGGRVRGKWKEVKGSISSKAFQMVTLAQSHRDAMSPCGNTSELLQQGMREYLPIPTFSPCLGAAFVVNDD